MGSGHWHQTKNGKSNGVKQERNFNQHGYPGLTKRDLCPLEGLTVTERGMAGEGVRASIPAGVLHCCHPRIRQAGLLL